MNAIGEMNRSIAVVAKYPFYFDDIIVELRGSNIKIVTANEIGEIQEKINSSSKVTIIVKVSNFCQNVIFNFLMVTKCQY